MLCAWPAGRRPLSRNSLGGTKAALSVAGACAMRVSVVAVTVAAMFEPTQTRVAPAPVPFVGCPADGQLGPLAPPAGAPRSVALAPDLARAIAYYKADQAPGVFAPRAWRCRAWYGSNGSFIVVSPGLIDSAHIPPRATRGAGVELSSSDGETSGRFDMAFAAARLFPRVAASFIQAVKDESIVPASQFPRGPYPHDRIRYLDSAVAAFTTPAHASGIGTEGYLESSGQPVKGIAVLSLGGDEVGPGIQVLTVRLDAGRDRLETAILELNRHCMLGQDPCAPAAGGR